MGNINFLSKGIRDILKNASEADLQDVSNDTAYTILSGVGYTNIPKCKIQVPSILHAYLQHIVNTAKGIHYADFTPQELEKYQLTLDGTLHYLAATNLHSINLELWNTVRKEFLVSKEDSQGMFICECCGDRLSNPQVHEEWGFTPSTITLHLKSLKILCRTCHRAKHLKGLVIAKGDDDTLVRIVRKLEKVNNISPLRAIQYIEWFCRGFVSSLQSDWTDSDKLIHQHNHLISTRSNKPLQGLHITVNAGVPKYWEIIQCLKEKGY